MPNIFISYRRADSQKESIEIYQKLADAFGQESVFLDLKSLPLGEHFPSYLDQMLKWADVVLVIIGPDWMGEKDKGGRCRIESRFDYVRIEIETSLLRKPHGVVVIPLIIKGASISSLNLPKDIEELKEINGREIDLALFDIHLQNLIKELQIIPGNQRKKPPVPDDVNQGIDIHQKIYIYEGEANPLPADALLFIRPKNDSWEVEIQSPSRPNRTIRIENDIANITSVQQVIGTLMEWYDILPEQCFVWRETRSPKKLLSIFSRRSENDGEWAPFRGNAVFTSLHKLLQVFDKFIGDYGGGICDIVPKSKTKIIENYKIWGVLADTENRLFGNYVCSLTTAMGGEEYDTGKLFYFPTAPNTRLQYLNVFEPPHCVNIKFCGHVGKDENGFHIVYI